MIHQTTRSYFRDSAAQGALGDNHVLARLADPVRRFLFDRLDPNPRFVEVLWPAERGSSGGGAILGGIVGAVAGNQIGGGNGRNAAIAAGAIIGTLAGDRAESNSAQANAAPPTYSEQAVRQCRTVDAWESRTTGYEVTYDYRGRNYTGFMSQDPGPRVRLRVSVDPISQ